MTERLENPSAESRGGGEMVEFQRSAASNRVEQGRRKKSWEKRSREGGWGSGDGVVCYLCFPARELLSPPSAAVTSSTRNDAMSNYTDK